jgi:uncharacterized protein YjdB
MKYLVILMTMLVIPAFAEIPEYLKDGQITVTLSDGTQYTFSSNEYKVVPRAKTQQEQPTASTPEIVSLKDQRPSYSVIVHAGVGNDGLDVQNSGTTFDVSERSAVVGGLTLCKNITEVGLCATGYTNRTFTLGVKFDID